MYLQQIDCETFLKMVAYSLFKKKIMVCVRFTHDRSETSVNRQKNEMNIYNKCRIITKFKNESILINFKRYFIFYLTYVT